MFFPAAVIWCAVAAWLGIWACTGVAASGGETAPKGSEAPLSGILVACKEYGTSLGVFVMDARGRDLRRLNHLCGEGVCPRLSPDGKQVLFTSTRGGKSGVWVMDRLGDGQKRICDGDQGSWSADGKQIFFRREGRILSRSLDSGQESVLSPASWTQCSWPSGAPDGQTILFVVRDGDQDAIMALAAGDQAPKRLVEGELPAAPRFDPSGERIAYQRGPRIWIMDADGGNQRQLTTAGGIQRCPVWSPDGSAIAYCQGPGPRGPWQLCATTGDATKTIFLGESRARRVLGPDWGTFADEGQPVRWPAKPAATRSEPGVSVWDTRQVLDGPPADWQAFGRTSAAWSPIAPAQSPAIRGGCVVQNETGWLFLSRGKAGLFLMSKTAPAGAIGFIPVSSQGQPAELVESLRVAHCDRNEAVVETVSRTTAGQAVRVSWRLGAGAACLQVKPLENAGKLRVLRRWRGVVVPDRFANDLVLDAQEFRHDEAFLVAAPLTIGLGDQGKQMLVLMRPQTDQTLELFQEKEGLFTRADVAFRNARIGVGLVEANGVGHLERFAATAERDRYTFHWQMPFPATWRLAVQGKAKCQSALFCEQESDYYAQQAAVCRKTEELGGDAELGTVYLYDRTPGTPLGTLTPVDLLREMLGLNESQAVLDIPGLTEYRTDAGWTTWRDFGKTVQSLAYLFERGLEGEQKVYLGHLCDDLPPLLEGLDQRLDEYERLAREIDVFGKEWQPDSPDDAPLVVTLGQAAKQFSALGKKRLGLRKPEEMRPLCNRIQELAAQESRQNARAFERVRHELTAIVGPREHLLRAYRGIAKELRDNAARACLTQAALVAPADRIRAICQRTLRNRHYVESDWRGEGYEEPLDWLGPRPYE